MTDLFLFGGRADGQAGVIIDQASELGLKIAGIFDSTESLQNQTVMGIPVIGTVAESFESSEFIGSNFHICIGNNGARASLHSRLEAYGLIPTSIISASASISKRANLGEGVYVGPRAIVNNGCSIGDGVIINSGVVLEHDSVINRFAHLAPGVITGGRVEVGDESFLGLGSVVIPDIRIGARSFIAAGTVVLEDIPETTAVKNVLDTKYRNIYEQNR